MNEASPATRPRRHPRKALGQHWLTERRYLERIVAAANVGSKDTIIEVGSGTGALTALLASLPNHLIAVEVDPYLVTRLQQRFSDQPNVRIIFADILTLKPPDLLSQFGRQPPYVVVGNLPFHIGTAILRHFLQDETPPRWLIVTLQAEVAANIAAPPGRMGYLSVETQYYAQPRILFTVPPKAFRPPPKVRAAVIRLDVRSRPDAEVGDPAAFLWFVQRAFAAPRKYLRNSLAIGLAVPPSILDGTLVRAGIDGRRRPQTLNLEEWAALYHAYRQSSPLSRQ